jgi:hypothetical protein
MKDEKRSLINGIMGPQPEWRGSTGGVGGRQGDPRPGSGGGGYLDICSNSESDVLAVDADPRFRELEEMGLGSIWLRAAKAVGIDNFLRLWVILDEKNMQVPPGLRDQARIRVPMFSRYERYQRNKLIASLSDNHNPAEIQKIIKKNLGEKVTTTHISRIIKKNKV